MGKSGNPAKRAAQENPEPVEYDPTPVDADGVEDFDAFWSEQDAQRDRAQVRIRGEVVTLPAALPLQFDLLVRQNRRSKDPKVTERLVGILFGQGSLDKWRKAGMDAEEFAVLLSWATQRIGGGTMSMHEVAEKLREKDSELDPH